MSLFAGVELVGKPCLENVRKLDLSILPILRKMHSRGMAVNREYFEDLSLDIEHQMEDLKKEVMSYIPQSAIDEFIHTTFSIDSPEQISSALFKHLKVGYDKELKLTKSGTRISSGKKQLEELKNDHPIIPPILQYRERAKLLNTYVLKLPKIARYDRATGTWRVHTTFGVTGTSTGRLNSSNPNLQNVPFRTDLGKRVRNGFHATPGYKLVSSDYSQIELRVLAHVANEKEMIRIFQANGDIHVDTCVRANSMSMEKYLALPVKEQKDMRLPAKTANFLVCLSQGQRILTDRGLIPIENVAVHDKLWDGVEWVNHSGVVFKGYREVIEYDGIVATRDHQVWVEDGRKMELSEAMAQGFRLATTGSDASPVRFDKDNFQEHRKEGLREIVPFAGSKRNLFKLQKHSLYNSGQHTSRKNSWLPVSEGAIFRPKVQTPVFSVLGHQTALRKPRPSFLSKLWGQRDKEQIQIKRRFRELRSGALTASGLQQTRHWSKKQQWSLCAGEPSTGNQNGKSSQHTQECFCELQRQEGYSGGVVRTAPGRLSGLSLESRKNCSNCSSGSSLERNTSKEATRPIQEKVRVYDILNAGPRRRFTCEGKLVSNCYSGTGLGLQQALAIAGVRQPLEWCTDFIENIWHKLYPDVRPFMESQTRNAMRYGAVWDLFGRVRLIPHFKSAMRNIQSDGAREAGNCKIQGTAAGIMKLAMAEVDAINSEYLSMGYDIHPLLSIHDQLVQECPEEIAEDYGAHVQSIFEAACPLKVLTKCDWELSDNWIH